MIFRIDFKFTNFNLDVKLNIKKTNTWGGAWNIDYVKVSSGAGNEFTFKLNGKEFKPGNTYSLSSPVYTKNSQPEESKKPKPAPANVNQNLGSQCQTMYEGEIETADEVGAGTDAQVKIWFTDNNGQVVGPLGITEVDGDTMEQGHKNKITVELTQKMDGLAKIALQHVSVSKLKAMSIFTHLPCVTYVLGRKLYNHRVVKDSALIGK